MNWDRIKGNWKQFKGKAKEQWGKLTDDDLDRIDGQREQLAGRIQETYGIGKDDAGIAVLAMAQALGVAAATVSHASCRIGDAADMMARCVIRDANAASLALGVAAGMACRDAAL